jgi:hypothetical protein
VYLVWVCKSKEDINGVAGEAVIKRKLALKD